MLTSDQFGRVCRLSRQVAGIELAERHRELVARRCRRVGVMDGRGLDALLDGAEAGDPGAVERLVSVLTTRFTEFFRHPVQLDRAAEHALAVARGGRTARIWCAGAATGEEPYSLSMRMVELSGDDRPEVTVLATDIHPQSMRVTEKGEYAEAGLKGVGPERKARFFEGAGPGRWRVVVGIRRMVECRVFNLMDPAWPVAGPLDVLFCRNVVMYLEAGCRARVLERMASLLAPDGLLVLDPAEHPGSAATLFSAGLGGVHTLRRELHRKPIAMRSET